MTAVRIVFMGTPEFAVPSLKQLLFATDLCTVAAVVTQPDRPAGRGRKVTASPVKQCAEGAGIPVETFTKLKKSETALKLETYAADMIVVAAYGRILPPRILSLPRMGCINVHASLLPRHRGASPIAHAIMAGDAETGVSIMQMEEGLDTGPVFAREAIPVTDDETCGSLTEKLADLGADLLVRSLRGIIDGSLTAQPQDDALATYAPLLTKELGCLDFALPADVLERRVRGLCPWPGAYSCCGDERVQILEATVEHDAAGAPGEVLEASAKGVLVACGTGALRFSRIKPAGRAAMPAAAWVAGRAVACGQRFVAPQNPQSANK